MSTAGLSLLLSVLALTGGMSFANLYTIGKVLAIESNCDPKIQSLLGCPSGHDMVGSLAIASAKTLDGAKKNIDIGINDIDSTSGTSQVIAENSDPKSNDERANIESLIPSTINAIPFP
ncbi:MAG: hypothetical protein GEU26_18490 [Nitrososphaeraceae archaeon]|nr:hypothetical protein [Nitrososphaeraceae archaeon]